MCYLFVEGVRYMVFVEGAGYVVVVEGVRCMLFCLLRV